MIYIHSKNNLPSSPSRRSGLSNDTTASISLHPPTPSLTPTFFKSPSIPYYPSPQAPLLLQVIASTAPLARRYPVALSQNGKQVEVFLDPNLFTSKYSTEISINHHIPPLLWHTNDSQWEYQLQGCNIPPKILPAKSSKPWACRNLTFEEAPSSVRRQSSPMSPLGRDFSKAVSNDPFLSPNTIIR